MHPTEPILIVIAWLLVCIARELRVPAERWMFVAAVLGLCGITLLAVARALLRVWPAI